MLINKGDKAKSALSLNVDQRIDEAKVRGKEKVGKEIYEDLFKCVKSPMN